jgi:hypothetical protein
MSPEKQPELRDKLIAGLEVAYARMLEMKRQKNSEVVVVREGKIVRVKPWLST